jgi:cytochrome bd-type quinol oxidase subunit 2
MSLDSTASSQHDRPATAARRPGMVRAMQVVLGLLAVAVFAQAVLAGLFLDGGDAWRGWHATNGMLVLPLLAVVQVVLAFLVWRRGHGPVSLALASVGLLVALLVQSVLGMTSQVAVHIPLGVAIFGLAGTLLARTRAQSRPATRRHDGGWPRPATTAPADHHQPMEGTP